MLRSNKEIVSLAKLDNVYVNLPTEYNYLFEIFNYRRENHGVTFAPLLPEGTEVTIAENLELYGGFYLNQYNEANAF